MSTELLLMKRELKHLGCFQDENHDLSISDKTLDKITLKIK